MTKPAPSSSSLAAAARRLAPSWPRTMSRDKADTLLLLATCALVLLPHTGHLPVWIIAVCAGLLGWRGWITFRGNRMPSRWLLLPIAALAMAGVYWNYKTFFGQQAGVSMLVMLLTFKLLEMHARRDLFVVLFLSFFLVLAGFFYSQSIGTALMMLAAVVAILTTQLSFQFTGTVPPLAKRLKLGAFILLLAAPVTLILFLFFPRIQGPLWGLPSDAHSGRTGLSSTMAPGNISNLALSDDIAFRAKFEGAPPAKSQLYWRGPVMGAFDGRTWSPLNPRQRASRTPSVVTRGEPLRYQVTLEPNGRRWLFALEMPEGPPQVPGNASRVGPDAELYAAQPINERVRYEAASFPNFTLQPNESRAELRQWTVLPQGFNPRTLEFAARLRQQSADPAQLVGAVLRHFRQENFRYTLEPPLLGEHSVDEFLFDTRAGFCEHYSGAFVVLMRAMGIPARVVTGYQGGEINPADGFMTVRQADAHAWSEVWIAGRGWMRVDPTAAVAPNRIEMNLTRVIPRQALGGLVTLDGDTNRLAAALLKVRQQWEAVNNAWNQWVLNYTPEAQRNFIRSLGFDNVDWRTLAMLMAGAGTLVMALIALTLLGNRQRRDPLEAVYEVLCRTMARRGYARHPYEGPRAYGERLAADAALAPEKKAALSRFLQVYETARYGTPGTHANAALSQLRTLLNECR